MADDVGEGRPRACHPRGALSDRVQRGVADGLVDVDRQEILELAGAAAGVVVVFGVGATPLRSAEAEKAVTAEKAGKELFEEAGRRAGAALEDPLSDVHASPEYRRDLARVLTRRALIEAAARAGNN